MTKTILKHITVITPEGFPVFAVIVRKGVVTEFFRWNKKAVGKPSQETKHENHAEWLLVVEGKVKPGDKLVITYPPCSHCLEKLIEAGVSEVICVFDPEKKLFQPSWNTGKIIFKQASGKRWGAIRTILKNLLIKRYSKSGHKWARIRLLGYNGLISVNHNEINQQTWDLIFSWKAHGQRQKPIA